MKADGMSPGYCPVCPVLHGPLGTVSAGCRCACHADQEYVPLRGWLPVAQAQADRRQYLDEDAAIEHFQGNEGD